MKPWAEWTTEELVNWLLASNSFPASHRLPAITELAYRLEPNTCPVPELRGGVRPTHAHI